MNLEFSCHVLEISRCNKVLHFDIKLILTVIHTYIVVVADV